MSTKAERELEAATNALHAAILRHCPPSAFRTAAMRGLEDVSTLAIAASSEPRFKVQEQVPLKLGDA